MAYDPTRGVTVLFGGLGANGALADVWEWDGMDWRARTPSQPPIAAGAWPPRGEGPSLVWDSVRQRVVLFGGGFTAGLWEWDGAAWTDRSAHAPSAPWPFKRQSHGAVYDSCRGVMLVFGGLINDLASPTPYGYGRDLWEWDSATGTFRDLTPAMSSDLPATDWPLATYMPATTFDAARQEVVIFGGINNLVDTTRSMYQYGP